MPCPFIGPKIFCAGPNFLSQPKNLTSFSASSKPFVPAQKAILCQNITFLPNFCHILLILIDLESFELVGVSFNLAQSGSKFHLSSRNFRAQNIKSSS
jgi:hypothetical protein